MTFIIRMSYFCHDVSYQYRLLKLGGYSMRHTAQLTAGGTDLNLNFEVPLL